MGKHRSGVNRPRYIGGLYLSAASRADNASWCSFKGTSNKKRIT